MSVTESCNCRTNFSDRPSVES